MTPKRVDVNQAEIVAALRGVPGVTVTCTHMVGHGFADLVVGRKGKTFLLEIKSKKGKLTAAEMWWHRAWQGHIAIVRTVDEALAAVGVI